MNKKTLIGLGVCALAFGAVIGAVSARSVIEADAALPTTLYLKPNANWKQADARFAAYFFEGGDPTWSSMALAEGETDVYTVAVPNDHAKVIFCRMNPGTVENNWDNKWNQTGDLTITEGKDLYTITEDTWGDGAWGVYEAPTPSSSSEAPVFSSEEASSEAPGSSEEESVPWYVIGTIGGDNWTVHHPLVVSEQELPEGVSKQYEISLPGLVVGEQFKVSDGTHWIGYDDVENKEKVHQGGDGNILVAADGDYKLYFKELTAGGYQIYVETAAVVPTIENGYYLLGLDGWTAATGIADQKDEASPDKAQYLHVTMKADDEFKIAKVEDEAVVWDDSYGWGALKDSVTYLPEFAKDHFENGGTGDSGNIKCVTAGTYSLYLNDKGELYIFDDNYVYTDADHVDVFVAEKITPYVDDAWEEMGEDARITSCQEKYARAKGGYDALSAAQKNLFDTDAKYAEAKAIYETWKASAANQATVWNISHVSGNTNLVVTLAIVLGGIVLAGGLYFVYRRRRSN